MSDDRRRVLEMVASGRVSVDDGERLLDALGRDYAVPARHERYDRGEQRDRLRADLRIGRRRLRLNLPGIDVGADLGGRGERYLAGFRQAFGDDLDVDALIDLTDHGVRPEYAVAMRAAFGDRLDADDLVRMHDHGVSSAYAKVVCDAFGHDIDPDDIVRLRDRGVGAKFLTKVQDLVGDIDLDDVIKLADHGVSAKYVAAAREAMGDDVDVDDIVKLHDHGVGVADLRRDDFDEEAMDIVDAEIDPEEPDEPDEPDE